MTIYVTAKELPLVLEFDDANLDAVTSTVGRWLERGATNVFRLENGQTFVIHFGRIPALTVDVENRHDSSTALQKPHLSIVIADDHGHDHDHDHF